jgi:uncharacterized protein (DUF2147 family)
MIIKKSYFFFAFVILSAIILLASAKINNEDNVIGLWLVGNGKARVKIEREGKKYFGKIVWLKNPNDVAGQPRVDKNNPDASKRKNPILGILLLKGFEYDGDNQWVDGTIYDPENGKTYSCKITLKDQSTLEVRGYIGISMFGRTDIWKRQKE